MEEAAKYEELAALLKAERDSQLNKISAGAAERGPGLAGPTGAVGVYNQDRFIRPTVDPLIEGLVVKAKQAALQNQLKQLADAASSRYQRAASAYAARQAAASSGSSGGSSGGYSTAPGENSVNIVDAPTTDTSKNDTKIYSDGAGGTYGYQAQGPDGSIGSAIFSVPLTNPNQVAGYLPPTAGQKPLPLFTKESAQENLNRLFRLK